MRKKLHILLRDAKHHGDILLDVLWQCLLLLDVEGQRVSHLHTNFPRDATVESVHRNSAEDVHGLHYDILAFCRFQFLLQSGTEYRPKSIEIDRTRLLHTIVLQFVHLSHQHLHPHLPLRLRLHHGRVSQGV